MPTQFSNSVNGLREFEIVIGALDLNSTDIAVEVADLRVQMDPPVAERNPHSGI